MTASRLAPRKSGTKAAKALRDHAAWCQRMARYYSDHLGAGRQGLPDSYISHRHAMRLAYRSAASDALRRFRCLEGNHRVEGDRQCCACGKVWR